MKTLNKILLTGIIIGSLTNVKGQESEKTYLPYTFLDDEFICESWATVPDTLVYKTDDTIVSPIMSQFDVKTLLKENSDSAVANLRHNRNFYNWIYKNISTFNFSGCNLEIFGFYKPLDNFNALCGVKNKARPLQRDEFLGTIISLLSKQQHGEEGVLSTKYSNVFFVRLDPKCIVSANIWYNSAWNVKAWEIQAYTMRSWGPKDKIFFAK